MAFLLFTVLTDISVIITKYDRNIGHFMKISFYRFILYYCSQ